MIKDAFITSLLLACSHDLLFRPNSVFESQTSKHTHLETVKFFIINGKISLFPIIIIVVKTLYSRYFISMYLIFCAHRISLSTLGFYNFHPLHS